MTLLAFTDASGGYYQYDWDDVSVPPEWTNGLTPCAVAPYTMSATEVCCLVDGHCDSIFSAGMSYGGTTFQICGESQRRIAARTTYALASKIDAVTFPWVAPCSDGWWDVDNVVLSSTQTVDGFLSFAKAASDYCAACSKCCRDHKSAITPENCTTYDYTTGWPVNS